MLGRILVHIKIKTNSGTKKISVDMFATIDETILFFELINTYFGHLRIC